MANKKRIIPTMTRRATVEPCVALVGHPLPETLPAQLPDTLPAELPEKFPFS